MKRGELHVHLLGSVLPECADRLRKKYCGTDLLKEAPVRQQEFLLRSPWFLRFSKGEADSSFLRFGNSLEQFFAAYLTLSLHVREAADLSLCASSALERFTKEQYDFVEVIVSPSLYSDRGIPLAEVYEALLSAKQTAFPLEVSFLLDPIRNRGADHAERVLQETLQLSNHPFSGVHLAGDESAFPLADFRRFYREADQAGLGLAMHSGETGPSSEVRYAVETLGATRIGHGLSAAEDPKTTELLAQRGVVVEAPLSGNVRTGVVTSYSAHPARALYEAGVSLTVCTDDPFFFRTSLEQELRTAEGLGMDRRVLLRNAERGRFPSPK